MFREDTSAGRGSDLTRPETGARAFPDWAAPLNWAGTHPTLTPTAN
jgi:hypothetical protein